MKNSGRFLLLIAFGILMLVTFNPSATLQQDKRVVTAEDYARAEKFMSSHTEPLVLGGIVQPTWIDENSFWYRNTIAEGHEFILVDVKRKQRNRAFDHEKLVLALSEAVGKSYEPFKLPFESFKFSDDRNSLIFTVDSLKCTYNIQKNQCLTEKADEKIEDNMMVSPDGKRGAFIREHNLWIRDLETKKETQLTT
ncbi:MAG: DPP IV N-terminal domain-containing protein, partial [Candidatus Aminicenantaceae bacterium]